MKFRNFLCAVYARVIVKSHQLKKRLTPCSIWEGFHFLKSGDFVHRIIVNNTKTVKVRVFIHFGSMILTITLIYVYLCSQHSRKRQGINIGTCKH